MNTLQNGLLTYSWKERAKWWSITTRKVRVEVHERPYMVGQPGHVIAQVTIKINGEVKHRLETTCPLLSGQEFLPLHVKIILEDPAVKLHAEYRKILGTFCKFFKERLQGVSIFWTENNFVD